MNPYLTKKRTLVALVKSCCIAMLVPVAVASAETYKLYINKDQSSANVVIFEDNLAATVAHTSEGNGTDTSRCRRIPALQKH